MSVSPKDPLYKIALEHFIGKHWADRRTEGQDIFEFPDFFYMDKLHISATSHFRRTGQPIRLKIQNNICSRAIAERLFYHNPYPYPIILDGAKNVLSIHDLIPLTHPELCLDNPDKFLRLITTLADESSSIHLISNYTSKVFTKILGNKYANKLHVAHQPLNFVPTPTQAEEIKCKSAKKFEDFSNNGEGYIIQIGTIEPKKNHLLSIEVIRQLRNTHPNLRLLVVGKRGWLCGSICDQLSSSKDRGIEWLGSLPRIVLKERLKNALAFIFPSIVEGWGLPPLEAMAMGIPAVVSGIESCKEASQSAGIEISDTQNPTAYSAAILELLKSKELYLDHVSRGLGRSADFSGYSFQQQAIKLYA
jgi:glycosyltransferase involved in cell wall biosynthesis